MQTRKSAGKTVVNMVAWLLLVLILTTMFYVSVSSKYPQVARYGDTVHFTDFAYYMKTVDQFWFTDNPTIYRMTTQSVLYSDLVGQETDQIVLPHLSPIALLVWFPAAWLAKTNPAAAHALWMGVSFTLYVMSAQKAYALLRTSRAGARIVVVLLYCIAFLSYSALLGITTGQSSFFACGLLILVAAGNGQRLRNTEQDWASVAGLTALALKPHYYVWGFLLVVGSGRRREALTSLGIVLGLLVLLSFRLGLAWPVEYLQIMAIHSQPAPPVERGITYDVASMFNFRGTFVQVIGERAASEFTMTTYAVLTIGAIIAGFLRGWSSEPDSRFLKYVNTASLMNVLVGSYLLFSPLIFPYEDVLLVAMLVSTIVHRPCVFGPNVGTSAVLAAALAQMNFHLFGQSDMKMALWIIRTALWLYLLYLGRPTQALDGSSGGENRIPTVVHA